MSVIWQKIAGPARQGLRDSKRKNGARSWRQAVDTLRHQIGELRAGAGSGNHATLEAAQRKINQQLDQLSAAANPPRIYLQISDSQQTQDRPPICRRGSSAASWVGDPILVSRHRAETFRRECPCAALKTEECREARRLAGRHQ